jgi:hypothetical protein
MWLSLILALAALTAALPNTPKRKALGGVLQVPWGTFIDETHLRLSQKLELVTYEKEAGDLQPNTPAKPLSHAGDDGFTLEYTGGFGSFEAEQIKEIEAGFDAKKRFSSLCVTFDPADPQPKSKTFEAVAEAVAGIHGQPDVIKVPKDSATQLERAAANAKVMKRSLGLAAAVAGGSKYEERDRLILSGSGEAVAVWKFQDGSAIFAGVRSELTEEKTRELSVFWCLTAKSAATTSKPKSDF